MIHRVLVVDDEPDARLLCAALAMPGYEIVSASNGAAALASAENDPVDIVLLSLQSPAIDGIEVLRQLRARETDGHLPVILLSASTGHDVRLRGFETGADEILEKPIDMALLRARVRGLMQRRDAHEQVRSRNLALERLQRERQELIQFLVHDLKNPIAIVTSNLQYLETVVDPADRNVTEALGDARLGLQRLVSMTDDLSTISRLEQSQVTLRLEQFALDELIAEIRHSHQRKAGARRLSLEMFVDSGLMVRADRALLRRVLENLTENALRYTPDGGSLALLARRDTAVEIGVGNTGDEIPVHLRHRIFEKFFRDDGPRAGSAGLGLYFCQKVIAAHGGSISVSNTPAWPTLFSISLPNDQPVSH